MAKHLLTGVAGSGRDWFYSSHGKEELEGDTIRKQAPPETTLPPPHPCQPPCSPALSGPFPTLPQLPCIQVNFSQEPMLESKLCLVGSHWGKMDGENLDTRNSQQVLGPKMPLKSHFPWDMERSQGWRWGSGPRYLKIPSSVRLGSSIISTIISLHREIFPNLNKPYRGISE
jgi:hypothetical protein